MHLLYPALSKSDNANTIVLWYLRCYRTAFRCAVVAAHLLDKYKQSITDNISFGNFNFFEVLKEVLQTDIA